MASVTQQLLRILEEEKQAVLVEEKKRIASSLVRSAAQRKRHSLARSLAQAEAAAKEQAERDLARIAAERALAAEQALAQQAADARALQAELARLRARSEIEVLRDEMAQMRAEQMATLKAYHLARLPQQEIHLRTDGELDMRFKSSKEELATARGEIAELKKQMETLLSGGFFIRNKRSGMMLDHDTSGAAAGRIIHAWEHNGQTNQIWTFECAK